jgi:hypothetical protein
MILALTLLLFTNEASALPDGGAFSTPGLRREQVVLQGALLRAGGPGGRRSAPDQAIEALCEKGVRTVYYLYPAENFRNRGTFECGRGSTDYKGGSFRSPGVKAILADVAQAIEKREGAVLVHCWNGSHAAGEVAAYALMQFCGYSGRQAAKYWADTLHDKDNLHRYGKSIQRIRAFRPFADLEISSADQSAVCP